MDLTEFDKTSQKYIENLKLYYTTILSHDITSDGKLLLATIKNNNLAVFPLEKYLKDINNESQNSNMSKTNNSQNVNNLLSSTKLNRPTPISRVEVENSLCLCLITTTNSQYKFALGGLGSIKGYKLSTENIQECHEEWTINFSNDTILTNKAISMQNLLLSGCGDNNIYIFDIETRQQLGKLSGHQNYIHNMKCPDPNQPILYSCSEDGSVRCWDIRSPDKFISSWFPFKNNNIKRSHFGKWLGALDVSSNNQWLLCGGGPSLSIWYTRSEKYAHIIDTPGVTYSAQFLADNSNVIAAGSESTITVWRRCDPINPYQIDSSINNIYSISHHYYEHFDYDLFSLAGDSYQIDICKNAKFIDWKLFVS